MVYTSNAIITAILAVSAAAPILAAPLGSRVDSGTSSVNSRAPVPPPPTQPEAVPAPASAPDAAARVTSSDVGPAVLNHHLTARGVEVEAGVKTGTAQSGEFLRSPTAKGLLGRAALAAIGSILRREPEFADLLLRELAREPRARNAPSSAITGGAASDAGIQHLNRAGGTTPYSIYETRAPPAETSSDSFQFAPYSPVQSTSGLASSFHSIDSDPFLSPPEDAGSFRTAVPLSPAPAYTPGSPAPAYPLSENSPSGNPPSENPPSENQPSVNPPSTGIVSQLKSLVNTPLKAIATGLGAGGVASTIALSVAKGLGHRDLDADTLHLLDRDLDADTLSLLLGRDLEDLFARSSGIDELD